LLLLQGCIKISNEPPSFMRSNMRRAWAAFPPEFFERPASEERRRAVRGIIFGLCFFHSVLLGRKKFGTGEWVDVCMCMCAALGKNVWYWAGRLDGRLKRLCYGQAGAGRCFC
jgi:hypothetical protein